MSITENDSKSSDLASKLLTTQNVIRKKFEKACKNRIKQENHTIKPFLSSSAPASVPPSDSDAKEVSVHGQKQSEQAHSTKIGRMNANKSINILCERLSLLLSTPITKRVKHTHEINAIIDELHGLGIIV